MPKKADYVLMYKGVKLAIVEAKRDEVSYSEGVTQMSLTRSLPSLKLET